MLAILQIIAIVQGIFLGTVLFQRRKEYQKLIFWLFMGCIISVVLFSIGDDDYNLIVGDSDWFFFHETLMITFFFLFIRYSHSDRKAFEKTDFIFLLPYLLNILFQIIRDISSIKNSLAFQISSITIELCFISMLIYSVYDVIKHKKEKWLLAFITPFTIIYMIDELSVLFINDDELFLGLDSYGIFLIAVFLFYSVTYKLITAPKEILPSITSASPTPSITSNTEPAPTPSTKYKLSNLSETEIESIKKELNRLMIEEQLFKNPNLSANETAKQIGITRQRLSEVLNVHMGMRFQDYLNQHRVEAFIKCLHQEEYQNFTLLGIATEVGFKSKSTFNAAFKKFKGMTPSQYKKLNQE